MGLSLRIERAIIDPNPPLLEKLTYMLKSRLEHDQVPSEIVRHQADRDAALWLGKGFDDDQTIETLRQLIGLPWRLVLCESSKGALAASLGKDDPGLGLFDRQRGGIHVIATDPKGQGLDGLPPRSLAVFLLNGRDDATEPEESSSRGGNAARRRRLNMIDELVRAKPSTLVVLGAQDSLLDDVFELWDEGFRAQLFIVDPDGEAVSRIDSWLAGPTSSNVVDHCLLTIPSLTESLLHSLSTAFAADRNVIRLGTGAEAVELDVTDCELIERPLLDRFELIQARNLKRLLPDELLQVDFNAFFDRPLPTWAPRVTAL